MPRVAEAERDDEIAGAVTRLRSGGVVVFPTETVYGLGAATFDADAIEAVYDLKGRPDDNPLIAHVPDIETARRLVVGWDDRCETLARRFWPGPLTLVLRKAAEVPDEATAGLPTIAVRCPRHPVARRLLAAFGGSISAPSANRSGHVSPTSARHVADDFADAGDLLILDGGDCEVGIESTVLDMTRHPPAVLRPGSVTVEMLEAAIGEVASPELTIQAASPGTAMAHYAPVTPARLVESQDLDAAIARCPGPVAVLCFDAGRVPPPHRAVEMPRDAEAYARRLFAALREADAHMPEQILVERPPSEAGLWRAVGDRLRRATTAG